MGILSALDSGVSTFTPYLNTGTLFDVGTGIFLPSATGQSMVLNGGLGWITGITGRPQTYKSALALSLAGRALNIYDGAELIVHDSEFSIAGTKRIIDLCGNPNIDENRIALWDNSLYNVGTLLTKIREIVATKTANKKEFLVDSPFIDPRTMKPIKMWIPTIICIDSLSKMDAPEEDALFEKHQLGDSKLNTIYMKDGNVKTQFMRQLPALAARAGIYFVITAHIGNKFDLDPYAKAPKELQYMRGTDSIKGVGSQFTFLTSILLETRKVTNLVDSKKLPLYPGSFKSGNSAELNEVDTIICRCKNNASGMVLSQVNSQYQGILPGVTNYHFLKAHGYFGLDGNNITQSCKMVPDASITRQSIRQQVEESHELDRSLQILAQLCYIQKYWSMYGMEDAGFDMRPSDFVNKVVAGGDVMSDILNSRGYWTYAKDDRKYMSIMDILKILKGEAPKKK